MLSLRSGVFVEAGTRRQKRGSSRGARPGASRSLPRVASDPSPPARGPADWTGRPVSRSRLGPRRRTGNRIQGGQGRTGAQTGPRTRTGNRIEALIWAPTADWVGCPFSPAAATVPAARDPPSNPPPPRRPPPSVGGAGRGEREGGPGPLKRSREKENLSSLYTVWVPRDAGAWAGAAARASGRPGCQPPTPPSPARAATRPSSPRRGRRQAFILNPVERFHLRTNVYQYLSKYL